MAGFAPSPAAAAKALAGTNTVTHQLHPGGAKGVNFSLEEVARRVKDGRNDPRIKGWAGRALIGAGRPASVVGRVQAILDAFRAQTMYVPDPTQTEMIAQAHVTLCLDEHGLCMPAGDCDDRVVACGSACASIGIQIEVVGQAFGSETAPSHVIFRFWDPVRQGWVRVDPSSDTWPVGQSAPGVTREWTIDPMDMTGGSSLAGMGEQGDYIGVGRLPGQGLAQKPEPVVVFVSDVQAYQAQLVAMADSLNTTFQACGAKLPASSLSDWNTFYTAVRAWGAEQWGHDYVATWNEWRKGQDFETVLNIWASVAKTSCGWTAPAPIVAPVPPYTPSLLDASSPIWTAATWIGVAVAAGALAYVAAPIVKEAAATHAAGRAIGRAIRTKENPIRCCPSCARGRRCDRFR